MILSLRALVQSKRRWQQFWGNIEQYGSQFSLNKSQDMRLNAKKVLRPHQQTALKKWKLALKPPIEVKL